MRPLAYWLGAAAIIFGVTAGAYHMVRVGNPEQVFVVVDTAFDMERVWRQVPGTLDDLDNDRYTEYALATDKGAVHGWDDELRLGSATPYAPRDLSKITTYPEAAEADRLILITNADSAATGALADWEVVRLGD